MQYVDPPMELGETLSGTDTNSNLINIGKLGQVFFHPAQRLTGGPTASKTRHTGKGIWAVLVRNTSGMALATKRIGQLAFATAGEAAMETVDGYATAIAQKRCVIIDPFLPSGGTVADDDIFWGVLKGRCLAMGGLTAATWPGDVAVGDELVTMTAASSQADTAGYLQGITIVGQTGGTEAFNMARNVIGYALSARTTANTGSDILIDACIASY